MNQFLKDCFYIDKKAIYAGFLISIGCLAYCICNVPIVNTLLFAFGFSSIMLLNLHLYTGKVGYIKMKKDSVLQILRMLRDNVIGVAIAILLLNIMNVNIGDRVVEISNIKLNQTYPQMFVSSFFCGIIIFIIAETYRKYKDVKAIILILLGLSCFILCGFDHCIANCFFFGMAGRGDWLIPILIMTAGNATGSIVMSKY